MHPLLCEEVHVCVVSTLLLLEHAPGVRRRSISRPHVRACVVVGASFFPRRLARAQRRNYHECAADREARPHEVLQFRFLHLIFLTYERWFLLLRELRKSVPLAPYAARQLHGHYAIAHPGIAMMMRGSGGRSHRKSRVLTLISSRWRYGSAMSRGFGKPRGSGAGDP